MTNQGDLPRDQSVVKARNQRWVSWIKKRDERIILDRKSAGGVIYRTEMLCQVFERDKF